MRAAGLLLLLALAAAAQPPVVTDFARVRKLKDVVASRIAQYPREEWMLLAFRKGERKFGKDDLTGTLVVTTCLVKWADLQQAQPTEAGKRVLALLPDVLYERYAKTLEIPKDRKDVSKILLDALDSDFLHVRSAAFESLRKIYRTQAGFAYKPVMTGKQRTEGIKYWRAFVAKQK